MHEGHRERVREKYKLHGLQGFADHEVLELLLFYANKRGDTNETAHRLLNAFGSLSAVLEAPYEELIKVKDVGDVAATLITCVPQLFRRYTQDKAADIKEITCASEATEYLAPKFFGLRNECVGVISLDVQSRIINFSFVAEGTVSLAQVDVRKIVEIALRNNAHSVILAHNHPSGVAAPSKDDVVTTQTIINAFRAIGIAVSDHIILCDSEAYAMSSKERLADMFA